MKKLAIIDDYERVALELADWSAIEGDVEISVFHYHLADEDALAARLADFEIVCMMRERTPFPRSLIEKLPKLEHLYTSGMRNWSLDAEVAREHGVAVTGTPTLGYPAAEHAWALILALAKRVTIEDAATRAGDFGTGVSLGLSGKTLGIIGLGKLGGQVAGVGKAFGMTVAAWSTNLTEERCQEAGVAYATKQEMFGNSDFISIHVHLGTRNQGLVGAAEIAMMKPTAYLINTARGPIIDEAALIAALQAKKIAGAGLDVFQVEPLQADNPLLGLDNVVLTPHQGYVTRENYGNFFAAAVANVRSWLDGKLINELP
ncbi:MAG: D-2-hydroxyacid dehydrogenase family protein [Rhodospirillales bacterium]